MTTIKSFTLNHKDLTLAINLEEQANHLLSYEFIRVYSPTENSDMQNTKAISHKKQVKLLAIESVAKHGYRFIFDDQHSAIYSLQTLADLCERHDELWQAYLAALKESGHSREAMINFTQL